MKKLLVLCALFFAMIAGPGPVSAATGDNVLYDLKFKANEVCKYPVELVVTGKSKSIDLPNDRYIVASPGQEVTVINLKTGESATFLITGTTHAQVQADGTTEFTVTGLNVVLNAREAKSEQQGLFLLEGNFNFALNSDGKTEARVFSGTGDVTDICALLA